MERRAPYSGDVPICDEFIFMKRDKFIPILRVRLAQKCNFSSRIPTCFEFGGSSQVMFRKHEFGFFKHPLKYILFNTGWDYDLMTVDAIFPSRVDCFDILRPIQALRLYLPRLIQMS